MISDEVFFSTGLIDKVAGECRARSDGTYVQADLALHCPQYKSIIEIAG